jgi:hypothetical protein
MSQSHHTRRFVVAIAAGFALLGAACSFDSSTATEQQNECRNATIDHVTRSSVHAVLGDPTTTQHETIGGQRRVYDVWLDGRVGFGFDAETEVLVEKDCDSG